MSNLQINNQETLLQFLKSELTSDSNLSIRGLAKLCGIKHTSLIRGGAFNSVKLGQTLMEHGFDAGALIENGFNAQASWLVIEYYAYESKAESLGAKQIARTFGSIGLQLTFEKLNEKPMTYIESLEALLKSEKEKEALRLKAVKQLLLIDAQSTALDDLFDYSSIIRVAKHNNCNEKAFNWRQLKNACVTLGLDIRKAPCPRYGTKNIYPHAAWSFVYPEAALPTTSILALPPSK